MTQVSRYGHILKVTVTGEAHPGTDPFPCHGLRARRQRDGAMLGGCFVMQALLNPVPVTGQTVLDGRPLATP
jgi:hypothetical protein